MGPSGRIIHVAGYIAYTGLLGQVNEGLIQELYLGRAPRTKETLPDFLKWRRVTRPPLVFRGLTGSQRTPRFWGVTYSFFKIFSFISSSSIYFILFYFFIHPCNPKEIFSPKLVSFCTVNILILEIE